jgi:uncharacterized protein (UPF0147 family)
MDINSLLDIPPWEWPSDAGEVIFETLTNRKARESDRLIAAELASNIVVMDDEVAEALLDIVSSADEAEALRARAAIALGPVLELGDWELMDDEFDDPDGVPITLESFRHLREALHKLYRDERNPREVRRRILEASVRSPQEWHSDAIKAAYASPDPKWKLTAVFAMGYVLGFEDQILEALESADADIHLEAVRAAGRHEVDEAWPHVVDLVNKRGIPKPLLLTAIQAVGSIRPKEAGEVLFELANSPDEEIAEAAEEAISMADAMSEDSPDEDEDEDDEDDGDWVN